MVTKKYIMRLLALAKLFKRKYKPKPKVLKKIISNNERLEGKNKILILVKKKYLKRILDYAKLFKQKLKSETNINNELHSRRFKGKNKEETKNEKIIEEKKNRRRFGEKDISEIENKPKLIKKFTLPIEKKLKSFYEKYETPEADIFYIDSNIEVEHDNLQKINQDELMKRPKKIKIEIDLKISDDNIIPIDVSEDLEIVDDNKKEKEINIPIDISDVHSSNFSNSLQSSRRASHKISQKEEIEIIKSSNRRQSKQISSSQQLIDIKDEKEYRRQKFYDKIQDKRNSLKEYQDIRDLREQQKEDSFVEYKKKFYWKPIHTVKSMKQIEELKRIRKENMLNTINEKSTYKENTYKTKTNKSESIELSFDDFKMTSQHIRYHNKLKEENEEMKRKTLNVISEQVEFKEEENIEDDPNKTKFYWLPYHRKKSMEIIEKKREWWIKTEEMRRTMRLANTYQNKTIDWDEWDKEFEEYADIKNNLNNDY